MQTFSTSTFYKKDSFFKFTIELIFWEENLLHPKADDEFLVLDVLAEVFHITHKALLLKPGCSDTSTICLSNHMIGTPAGIYYQHITEIRNSASIHMMTKNPNRLVPLFQQLTEVSCSS